MHLEIVQSYTLDGLPFATKRQARVHLENQIGKILDSTPLRMDARQAFAVFAAIVKNKERLCELLSVQTADDEGKPCNLLDIAE